MKLPKDITQSDFGTHIAYTKSKSQVGEYPTFVVRKIPEVSVKTIKVTGYTYHLQSTIAPKLKQFKTKDEALKHIIKHMRKNK